MKLTLRHLRHALALERHGSFHRAAGAEAISQPAFSRSIRALEDTLGAQLFDRTSPRVLPTAFGKALLRRAREVIDQSEEIRREIDLLRGLYTGHLAVAMGVFAAEVSAAAALGELVRRHPGIRCRSSLATWRTVVERVLSGAVDLGTAEISTLRDHEALSVAPVGQHPVVFFCRAGHPLLSKRRLAKADLDAFPMAVPRAPRRALGLFPGDFVVDPETDDLIPAIEVEELVSARAVVLASNALSLAAPIQIESSIRQGELCVLPYWQPGMQLDYGFIWIRNRLLSPAAEMYMDIVRELEVDRSRRNQGLFEEFCPQGKTPGSES
ncbi:MAG: LysR family transcriptional regulator [Xanthomonadales bacterium]|nr:LysR family transcriptional regulator [Xanthomonadales bacterium]